MENPDGDNLPDGSLIPVKITLNTFPNSDDIMQRAFTAGEGSISQFQVLVFIDGKYSYIVNSHNLSSPSAGVTTLTVYLSATSKPVDLCFLANADTAIPLSGIKHGDTKAVVARKLTVSYGAGGVSSNFPMFGIYSSPTGLNTAVSLPAVNVVRGIARIDVDASSLGNFVLSTVQGCHINDTIQIIPNNWSTTVPVTSPSARTASPGTTTNPLTVPAGNLSTSQLYLPEANGLTTGQDTIPAGCVVIGGYYNGSSTLTYYRLNFSSSGNPFGQILRNRIYRFTVGNITRDGYKTASDAANSYPVGISATVRDWDMTTTDQYIDANGNNYFNVNSRFLIVGKESGSSASFTVNTNISPYLLQWADASGNPSGTASTSLNNGTFSVSVASGGSAINVNALAANNTSAFVTNYVLVTAMRIRVLLTINQSAFTVTPSPISISASGTVGRVFISKTDVWAGISNQSWFSYTNSTGTTTDTIKWTASQNPTSSPRSGALTLYTLAGETKTIPFVQDGQNTTTLNITSYRGSLIYLGSGISIGTAETYAKIIKAILVNTTNFGPAGRVNLAGFTIAENSTNPITAASIGTADILWISYGGTLLASGANVMNWLNGAPNRVLITMVETNQNLMPAFGVTGVATASASGTYPLQFNSNTAYFTTTGPFTSYPYTPISSGFTYRNFDGGYNYIPTASNPQITPILTNAAGNILLGIDKTRRIVFVCDGDLVNPASGGGGTTNNYLQDTTGAASNSASKLWANVWAWVVQTALGQSPN